ncbi:hypothetical protein, partial [Mycolicibacterium celeriflavum]|uniref:hypothetical protein n=1 Tax=Mycolicibacterium celeriflavum TaxID=1249101 RepID=UPI001A99545C
QMILEHIGRLDDVIINADQDHLVLVHARSFRCILRGYPSRCSQCEETIFSPYENQCPKATLGPSGSSVGFRAAPS